MDNGGDTAEQILQRSEEEGVLPGEGRCARDFFRKAAVNLLSPLAGIRVRRRSGPRVMIQIQVIVSVDEAGEELTGAKVDGELKA